MKRKDRMLLIAAWASYIAFSYLLFPTLSITVFLASIPLTLLAGWLAGNRGVITTTLLCIPYHFAVLTLVHSGGDILHEAFNPLGLGLQLLFGHGAVLFKSTRDRKIRLNNSLEELIEERTRNLSDLTRHLIAAEEQEYSNILKVLLEAPLSELKTMRGIGKQLAEHLESTGHALAPQGTNLVGAIETCINDLMMLEHLAVPGTGAPIELAPSIRALSAQLTYLSGVEVECVSAASNAVLDPETTHHLWQIVHEAVSNAIQHAKPSRIEIGIEENHDTTILFIENNGTPFGNHESDGIGLPIMNYRAAKIGARLRIASLPNQKTRVECTLRKTKA
ncbi:sensor histidine kinase [Pontiella sp.]|uniref:sensor histidine kinase n=1 Tax=Pontiella sp. TaxID=2837462 RepID=UPI003564A1FB